MCNIRKCKTCGVEKPIENYVKSGFDEEGNQKYRHSCKTCHNKNWKYRLMSSITSREYSSKRTSSEGRTKVKSKDKELNFKFLDDLRNKQGDLCYWLKIPMDFTMIDVLRKPSLDRLDNTKGYLIDNVVLTTVFANTGRRDATINQMRDFVETYLQI